MMPQARVEGTVIKVWQPYSQDGVRRAKAVPGARWAPSERCWTYPATPASAAALEVAWGGVEGDTGYAALLEQGGRMEQAQAIKTAPEDRLAAIPGIKTAAWRHQRAAYWWLRELISGTEVMPTSPRFQSGALLHMGLGTG